VKGQRSSGAAKRDSKGLRAFVKGLPDELFDGHTEFSDLKPEQKLQWLSHCVRFAWETRKAKSAVSKA
jgi:hypothetical protein